VKTPFLLAGLLAAGTTLAQAPLPGKYRCYQPPAYTVTAWFELGEGRARIDGGDPAPFRYDAAAARIDWTTDALAPHRHGFHYPAGVPGDDAGRPTIVLAPRAPARPGQPGWARLPRCYLITH
jgi:hypothetical protein